MVPRSFALAIRAVVTGAVGGGGAGDGGVGIVPYGGLGARMFVPRIVATDGTGELWHDLQRSTIFWFGQVDSANNHHDVRVGYGDDYLMGHVAVFDRKIYDEATDDALAAWDAVTLYLETSEVAAKDAIDETSWRIDAQAHRPRQEDATRTNSYAKQIQPIFLPSSAMRMPQRERRGERGQWRADRVARAIPGRLIRAEASIDYPCG